MLVEIVNRFLDEIRQIWGILQRLSEFHVLNKGSTKRAIHLFRKFITIVETFTKVSHPQKVPIQ